MEKELYDKFIAAKRSSNIIELKRLYNNNSDDLLIKFEYAKALRKVDMNLSKKLIKELIGTSNENFALLELGSIERSLGNYELSRCYFESILKDDKFSAKDKDYATLELGKLEVIMKNKVKAREHFNSLSETPNACYAALELGKIALSEGNIDEAKECFKKGIGSKCGSYSLLWLGRAELASGNQMSALLYFNEVLKSPVREHARREIEKIRSIQRAESDQLKKRTRRKEDEK